MESLVRLQSTKIQYSYEVQSAALPAPFTVNFYRSSDATFDPGDVLIATSSETSTATLTPLRSSALTDAISAVQVFRAIGPSRD